MALVELGLGMACFSKVQSSLDMPQPLLAQPMGILKFNYAQKSPHLRYKKKGVIKL